MNFMLPSGQHTCAIAFVLKPHTDKNALRHQTLRHTHN